MVGETEQIPIRFFGVPRYEADNRAFFPAKGFILVAALLLAPRQTLTRQAAASLLWDNVEQKRALGNLRQLLLRLQQFAKNDEPTVLLTGNDLAAGNMALRSDLAKFLSSMQSDDIETRKDGLLCVHGELLQEAEAGDQQFYLWLLSERTRLKELFFTSFSQLLEDITRFGGKRSNHIAALADCALRLEPEREDTYRSLMMAYARTGDLDASQRVYDNLNRLLKAEGEQLEPATIALHRRIKSYVGHNDDKAVLPERPSSAKPRVAFMQPVGIGGTPATPVVQAFIEDIANSLVRYRTFTVLSPHSSFAALDLTGERYRTLRADYRIQSTLFEDAHLSIALVEEGTGEIIWSLEIVLNERQVHTAFRLLSKQVAGALADRLEQHQIEPGRRHDASAYLHLLAGQQLIRGKCDLPILRRARAEFRKAVELDPNMSAARARISQTLQLEWLMLGGGDPHLLHRAKAEAEASIEIDPALGIGHWMSAVIALHQRDFDTSADKFFEAEALAPNSADLLLQHADALAHFGQSDEAWERFQKAIDLNPFAPDIYWWAGASIALKREDYTTAVELCSQMENDEPALRVLTVSHALNGNLATAREYGKRLQENHPGMTARQISMLSPDRDPAVNDKLFHAYRLAGIK